MSCLSRRLAVSAITVLATGVCAAPALAAQPTRLAQVIHRVQPGTDLNFDESLGTPAQDNKAIRALAANAYARRQAADRVARIPAIAGQRGAKAEWLRGQAEGIREDGALANAVFTLLSGNTAAGRRELNSKALRDMSFDVNKWTSNADQALGIG